MALIVPVADTVHVAAAPTFTDGSVNRVNDKSGVALFANSYLNKSALST